MLFLRLLEEVEIWRLFIQKGKFYAKKAEHDNPYAKQVTMQRDVRKTVIFSHFQFEFLCIVSDDGFEMVLKIPLRR